MKRLLFRYILLFPFFVHSQLFYPVFNSVDDRSNAMGRIGITGAKGCDAIFSNPALLATQNSSHFTVGTRARAFLIKDESRNASVAATGNSYEAVGFPHIKLTKLGMGMPITLTGSDVKFGVGLGYFTPVDQGFTIIEEQSQIEQGNNLETTAQLHGGLSVLSPALSIGFKNLFFAGFSINTAFLSSSSTNVEFDISGSTPSNSSEETTFETAGTFVVFGLAGRPLPSLLVSVRLTSGFDLDFDEGKEELNNDGVRVRNDLPKQQIEIPSMFAAGLEYQVNPAFSITLGYQNRKFSEFEDNNQELEMENGYATSLGLELLAGDMALRAGVFAESQLLTDTDINSGVVGDDSFYVDDDPITGYGATFGLGIPIGSLDLDLGFEYAYLSAEETNSSSAGIVKYDYIEDHLRLNVGLTYNWGYTPTFKSPNLKEKPVSKPLQLTEPEEKPTLNEEEPALDNTPSEDFFEEESESPQ